MTEDIRMLYDQASDGDDPAAPGLMLRLWLNSPATNRSPVAPAMPARAHGLPLRGSSNLAFSRFLR